MTTAHNTAQRPDAVGEGLLARHPLLFYFLIAYAFSWLAWLPLVLSEDGADLLLSFSTPIGFDASLAIASFGPTVAAFIMAGITEGRAGIHRLLRKIVLWRVGLRWYLFALVGVPVLLVLGAIVVPGILASFEPMNPLSLLISYVPFFVYPALIIGGHWAKSLVGAVSRCLGCRGATVP
jgi:hypothetical protein